MTNGAEKRGDSSPRQPSDELLDLAWGLSEGSLSETDAARLEALLANPANRVDYTQFMQMVAGLEWQGMGTFAPALGDPQGFRAQPPLWTGNPIDSTATGNSTASTGVERTSPSALPRLSLYRPFSAALCASLATFAAVFLVQHWNETSDSSATALAGKPAPMSAAPIAYLSSATGYRWGNDSPHLQIVGSPVNVGDAMTLQEGVAEFRLSNGVRLSLEGPAGVVMTSTNSLVLQYGKLTTYIPESVPEFKVMAGASRLTASGAAFGIDLAGGKTEIHVFSGEVTALNTSFMENYRDLVVDEDQHAANDETTERTGIFEHITVVHGRSLTLSDDKDTVYVSGWGSADESKFTTRLPLAEPLQVTRKYVEAVRAADPAGYWRFEASDGNLIKNDVRNGFDLHVLGKIKLVSGADNHVLELGGSDSDGFLMAQEATNALSHSDYSVEVWLRPNHVHAGAVVTFAGESPETHDDRPGFYLGLHGFGNIQSLSSAHPSVLRYLNRNPPSGDAATGANCYSGDSYQVRRWQHVVAVKKGAETRLYLNGEMVANAMGADSLAKGLRLIIGEASTTQRTYRYCGQLDELSIYQHALSEEEVHRHFRAVPLPAERKGSANKETI